MEAFASLELMFVFSRDCWITANQMGWLVKAFTGEPFGDKFHGHLVATSQREKLHQHTRMQMFDENG